MARLLLHLQQRLSGIKFQGCFYIVFLLIYIVLAYIVLDTRQDLFCFLVILVQRCIKVLLFQPVPLIQAYHLSQKEFHFTGALTLIMENIPRVQMCGLSQFVFP